MLQLQKNRKQMNNYSSMHISFSSSDDDSSLRLYTFHIIIIHA